MAAAGKKQIIDGNIDKLDKDISKALEKRAAHIAEKAELLKSNTEFEEKRTAFLELFADKKAVYCIDDNKQYVSSIQKSVQHFDRLMCIDAYSEENIRGIFSSKKDAEYGVETVVYLKNPLTDIAFSRFSKLLKDARVSYKESFADVCEEVYYNRSPFCILPLENYEDGRLSGFVNMIRKYELKIVLTCNVENANGKITKFALLKRELTKIACSDKAIEGVYLEIGFNFGEESRLQDVLTAASYFGYKLNKVDSLPIYYSEKEYYFDVVFSGEGNFEKFIHWLELEIPRYEILGVYTQLKTL